MATENPFVKLFAIDFKDHLEVKKSGNTELKYVSWAYAWAEVKKLYPSASYEVKKFNGLPYVYDPITGFMVYTSVTIEGVSHEMWLPVLDSANKAMKTSVYKGYKRDKIEMRVDRVEVSDFPLYLNTVAGGLDRRDQTIGGFSFVVKIYALPVVEIIGQLLYLLGRYGFNTQFGDCL